MLNGSAFFFDDSGVLDTVGAKGSGVCSVKQVYGFMGAVLDEDKSQSPAPTRIYLHPVMIHSNTFIQSRADFRSDLTVMLSKGF